jgi:hypothetical protein
VNSTHTEAREKFRLLLDAAIAEGRYPCRDDELRPRAVAAVARVARQHPDATPEDIAAAFDVFDLEQREAEGAWARQTRCEPRSPAGCP